MDWMDILKVVGLYLGILGGGLAVVFILYHIFMSLVMSFGDSVSYNVYRPIKEKKLKRPPPTQHPPA
jgi:hypothetical protein